MAVRSVFALRCVVLLLQSTFSIVINGFTGASGTLADLVALPYGGPCTYGGCVYAGVQAGAVIAIQVGALSGCGCTFED